RSAGDAVVKVYPDIVTMAKQSRQFLIRAVRVLAGELGVRQFLDIGTGLPTLNNTHEVAQAVAPESKIVYVDNDHCKSGCAHTSSLGVWQLGDTARTNPSPGHRRRGPASER
ncbi:MAG TPA: SAM-dependent methyltransferase, partial [Pseudonocardiaceae bacterium]|nr:SAM-dependent methyltransferase [Pseudonocardiaceae bacterium]